MVEDGIVGTDVGAGTSFSTPLLARRTAGRPLAERLFALQILGDDRAVARTYIVGALAYSRDGVSA